MNFVTWQRWLGSPIEAASVAAFRIVFGAVMAWEALYLLRIDFAQHFLHRPPIRFPYAFTGWVPLLPEASLILLFWLLFAASILVCLGLVYRPAMLFLTLGTAYWFGLDKGYYNNHLYLIVLLGCLLASIPADATFALASSRSRMKPLRRWMLLALQLQVVLVYFFGGVAKLSADWLLAHEPIGFQLKLRAAESGLPWLARPAAAALAAWGGLFIDLVAAPAMLFSRTRGMAIALVLLFNATNAWLFNDINIFPFLMMGATLLFVPPRIVGTAIRAVASTPLRATEVGDREPAFTLWPTGALLGAFFAVQIIVPLRWTLGEGHVDWHGVGQRFSWRMKVMRRSVERFEFTIVDHDHRRRILVPVAAMRRFGFNRDQLALLAADPEAARRFAHFLAADHRSRDPTRDLEVFGEVVVSFNGRPAQSWLDPGVDLLSVDRPRLWQRPASVVPLASAPRGRRAP